MQSGVGTQSGPSGTELHGEDQNNDLSLMNLVEFVVQLSRNGRFISKFTRFSLVRAFGPKLGPTRSAWSSANTNARGVILGSEKTYLFPSFKTLEFKNTSV